MGTVDPMVSDLDVNVPDGVALEENYFKEVWKRILTSSIEADFTVVKNVSFV